MCGYVYEVPIKGTSLVVPGFKVLRRRSGRYRTPSLSNPTHIPETGFLLAEPAQPLLIRYGYQEKVQGGVIHSYVNEGNHGWGTSLSYPCFCIGVVGYGSMARSRVWHASDLKHGDEEIYSKAIYVPAADRSRKAKKIIISVLEDPKATYEDVVDLFPSLEGFHL